MAPQPAQKIPVKRSKTFVIDTNVLLHNPGSLFAFAEHHVVIPMIVLEELDRFKGGSNELGRNAREVARSLDKLRGKGSLREGVETPQKGIVQVIIGYDPLDGLLPGVNDNHILGCAHLLRAEGHNVFFISKDINARIKADALGIESQDFNNQKVNADQLYTGYTTVAVTAATVDKFAIKDAFPAKGLVNEEDGPLHHNQFVLIVDKKDENHHVLAIFDATKDLLRRLDPHAPELFGVKPRSAEQRMAFELLLDPEIKLVTLVGRAGTGKTLLALACGLTQVIHDERYKKLLVSRPIMPLGQDIGYLPGSKDDKLAHWMGPIFDNLHFLFAAEERDPDEVVKRLIEEDAISLEALTYIRGRSISKQFAIVDEAQNLTPHEIKTIITRAGENTKMVFTGDIFQIDHPYLDIYSNGLSYLIDKMQGQKLYTHIFLEKGERSELAELASDLL